MAELRGSYTVETVKPSPEAKKKKAPVRAEYNTFRDNPAAAPVAKPPPPAQSQPGGLFGPLMKVLQSK